MIPDTTPSSEDSHGHHNHVSHDDHFDSPVHSTLVDIALMFSLALLPGACCSIIGSTITLHVINDRLEKFGLALAYKRHVHANDLVARYVPVAISLLAMFVFTLHVYFKRLRSAGQDEIRSPTLLPLHDPQHQHSRVSIVRKILKLFILIAVMSLVILTKRIARGQTQNLGVRLDREPFTHDRYVHEEYSRNISVPYRALAHVLIVIITSWLAFASWFALLCTLYFEKRRTIRNASVKAEANLRKNAPQHEAYTDEVGK